MEAKAFHQLDDLFGLGPEAALDEAFDWIFMSQAADWELLKAAWSSRSPAWREACAYVLGSGPVPESLELLRYAVFDEDDDVAAEAACSYAGQWLQHGAAVPLHGPLLERLREILEAEGHQHLEEVCELLQRVHLQEVLPRSEDNA
jgi:HEAT repeat protein